MISCKEASELISQSMDRRLSFAERVRIRIHLLACQACTQYGKQLRFLRLAASRFSKGMEHGEQESSRLSPEARERIKKALK